MKTSTPRASWYSQLIVIIIIAFVLLCMYLGYQELQKPAPVSDDIQSGPELVDTVDEPDTDNIGNGGVVINEITLSKGTTAEVSGLSLTFNHFVADYRCPVDVQCIQAGAIVVNVTMEMDSKKETRNFPSDEVPYEFAGKAISIVKIAPEAHSEKTIAEEDYRITFKVE